jgi:hypothetical protein
MRKESSAHANPGFRQRRPAQMAERELLHLELVLANFVECGAEQNRLPTKYWDMRVAQLDTDYDLVPSQSQRVATLQRKLALLDAALAEASMHEEERRRAAA